MSARPPSTASPWLRFERSVGPAARRRVAQVVAECETPPHVLGDATPAGSGIVCFSGVDDDLWEFLRGAARTGDVRILAIDVSDNQVNDAWPLLRAGASDVFRWSDGTGMRERIDRRFERWHAVDALIASPYVQAKLIGESPAWLATLRSAAEIAHFTDASVLLIGESGTGKELAARLIHELDARARRNDMVVLDCTTIVGELSGSEFFGHERGAFTGASSARDGAFALADGGTLFLDEIGELPLPLQAQLLRVIQERTYKRVGGNVWHQTDFRLVCATHRDLAAAVKAGQFRHDLYHRIAAWTVNVPPLRERTDDILPLARHFLRLLRPDIAPADFDEPVGTLIQTRTYPGNVRELRQFVERIASRHVGPGPISAGAVPFDELPIAGEQTGCGDWRDAAFEGCIRAALQSGAGLKEIGRVATDTAMRLAVQVEGGNLRQAARRLGVSDRALQMRRAAQRPSTGA